MKNKLIRIYKILLLFIIATLSVEVFAHPGRTDSQGGHYNHSTGEYHYHHGCPPHQHPNGICPYDNKDIYDSENDSSSSDDSDSGNNLILPDKGKDDSDSSGTNENAFSLWDIPKYFLLILCALFYPILFLLEVIRKLSNKIKERKLWKQEHDYYYELYANKDPLDLVNIPSNVYLKDGYPATHSTEKYGLYTVYITPRGKCYHQDPTCCSNVMTKHIVDVCNTHRPCQKCCYWEFPDYLWYYEYINIVYIKNKYNLP